jgi:hypothetical protein
MTTTIYPTTAELPEPWLLNKEDLIDLSKCLQLGWEEMEAARQSELERSRDEALGDLRNRYPDAEAMRLADQLPAWGSRELEVSQRFSVLRLDDGLRVEALTLEEALEKRDVLETRTIGFEVTMSSGERKVAVSSHWLGSIRLESKPDSDEIAQRIFDRLLHWREKVQSPRWVVAWKRWNLLGGLLVALPLYVLAMSLVLPSLDRNASAWREQARQLLNDGLSDAEENRALEILLASQAQYPAPQDTATPQATPPLLRLMRITSIAFIIVLFAVANPPRNTIGLGPGVRRLLFYQWWMRLVSVGIPVTLFGSLILDPFLNWLRDLL